MLRITRVRAVSVAKIMGTIYALLGLLIGLAFAGFGAIAGTLAANIGADESQLLVISGMAVYSMVAIVAMPIMYGIMGFIGGLIMGAFYNLVAGWVGGIEIETE